MTRLLMRWALLLSALWLLPLLLFHAHPYDDGGLREFLTPPEDCPAPCFMGIRPGVSTAGDTMTKLGATQELVYNPMNWDEPGKTFFRLNRPNRLMVDSLKNYISVRDNLVQGLEIQTNISLGELWLSYGQADWGIGASQMGASSIYYTIGYADAAIEDMVFKFAVCTECGLYAFQDVIQAKLTIQLGADMQDDANMQPALLQFMNARYWPES